MGQITVGTAGGVSHVQKAKIDNSTRLSRQSTLVSGSWPMWYPGSRITHSTTK